MIVNDSDRTKEGITVFNLYSAQDYCIIRENDNLRLSNVSGINIFCDHRNEFDVITVAEYPYIVLSNTPELKKDEVLNFLKYSNDFSEFKEHFGEPIGDNIFTIYYLENDSDEELFLKNGTDNFEIYGIDVVDNLKWIENFWDDEE